MILLAGLRAVQTLFAWRQVGPRVSEVQSITLLHLCPKGLLYTTVASSLPSDGRAGPSAGHHHSRSAASAAGRHAPLASLAVAAANAGTVAGGYWAMSTRRWVELLAST